jgi:peptide/nickel transport system substrate-binding protein
LKIQISKNRKKHQEENAMSHPPLISRLFVLAILASLILTACGGAATPQPQTTEPAVVETAQPAPAETAAPAEVTEAPQPVQTEAPAAETSTDKKVLTITFGQEFDNLSPLYSDMWFVWVTWQLWNAWAWEFDEKNIPFPKLVTEIPSTENGGISEDGKVITVKLRDDIQWSDGEPITGDDFIFTYEMAVSPSNTVASAYPYDKLEKVEAPDPQTVVMTFTDPFAPWQATLWHGILPAHILKPIYDAEGTLDNADWLTNPTVGCVPQFRGMESAATPASSRTKLLG